MTCLICGEELKQTYYRVRYYEGTGNRSDEEAVCSADCLQKFGESEQKDLGR